MTPQQNGIVEQKNRTIQDMIRHDHNWWAEVTNTVVHIINRGYLRLLTDKTTYESGRERNLN